jgi:hypothetical protein
VTWHGWRAVHIVDAETNIYRIDGAGLARCGKDHAATTSANQLIITKFSRTVSWCRRNPPRNLRNDAHPRGTSVLLPSAVWRVLMVCPTIAGAVVQA